MNRVNDALNLRRLGWSVVPATRGSKFPRGAWSRWQQELPPERWVREVFGNGDDPNVFVITGSVSRLCVLDCDDEVALKWWAERLGDVLEETSQVNTSKGRHFYFRLKPGQVERSRASGGGDTGKWDLQAEGKGVVAPPSIHESGRTYQWAEHRGPEALKDAPDELFDGSDMGTGDDGQARSILRHLLDNPPAAEGEGRNNWLARVAGHYAKHIPYRDAYEGLVREQADKFREPLPEEEIRKLLISIWDKEQAKKGKGVAPPAEDGSDDWRIPVQQCHEGTGWLCSGGNRILVRVYDRERKAAGQSTWLNADIRVLGIIDTEDTRVYEVEIRKLTGERIEATVESRDITDTRRLHAWLGTYGVHMTTPDDMAPRSMSAGARLGSYLESQGAPAMEAVPALGWHEDTQTFITHDGVITENGPRSHEQVRPDPHVKKWATYRYGFVPEDEARDILCEVLKFHDERVVSVFASWVMAAILKPQIMRYSSQFPIMAVEASSESGKTVGFFPLMMELTGYSGGQTNQTKAALRDTLTSHNSGIAWMDDLDDLEAHGELIRQVTVGGSLIKKGDGNHEQVVATMRAALVVSGEGLGLRGQKALLDRAILLDYVPSPTERRNERGDLQWEDILALQRRYPDLTDVAGTIVQLVLKERASCVDLRKYKRGTGRFADKVAVVRLGARLLERVAGERASWCVKEVDRWAEELRDLGKEDALTLRVIPEALRATGWQEHPLPADDSRRMPITPVLLREGVVWFNLASLEQFWSRYHPGEKRQRTGMEDSFERQAQKLGLSSKDGKPIRILGSRRDSKTMRYWNAGEMSGVLYRRSRGLDDDELDNEQEELL